MNGRIIPNIDLVSLPIGTRLLINCIDDPNDDFWAVCTIAQWPECGSLYLKEECSGNSLTDIDDLDNYLVAYEYNETDAKRLVKELEPKTHTENAARYIFDKDHMVILDTVNNCIVCLVDTKRPDLLERKLGELLELANRSAS